MLLVIIELTVTLMHTAAASSHFSPAKTAPSAAGGSGGSEDVPSPAPLTAAPRLEGTGPSVLSVADRVVTEYEKLLEAMPVLSCHMGKLQLDTEAMAEGELVYCRFA